MTIEEVREANYAAKRESLRRRGYTPISDELLYDLQAGRLLTHEISEIERDPLGKTVWVKTKKTAHPEAI